MRARQKNGVHWPLRARQSLTSLVSLSQPEPPPKKYPTPVEKPTQSTPSCKTLIPPRGGSVPPNTPTCHGSPDNRHDLTLPLVTYSTLGNWGSPTRFPFATRPAIEMPGRRLRERRPAAHLRVHLRRVPRDGFKSPLPSPEGLWRIGCRAVHSLRCFRRTTGLGFLHQRYPQAPLALISLSPSPPDRISTVWNGLKTGFSGCI